MKRLRLLLILNFIFLGTLSAQDNSEGDSVIKTDRPDATESSSSMQQGEFQVETGFILTKFDGPDNIEITNYTYNNTLLRYGLLKNLELRVGWNILGVEFSRSRMEEHIETGFTPFLTGVKIGITEEKGLLPEMALLGHVYFPFTASKQYKPDNTAVDFRFAFSHTLSEKSILAYNLGAQWQPNSAEMEYLYTASYSYKFTKKFGGYAEIYGELPEHYEARHYIDGGLTYLISNNFQLDAYVGTGLNNNQKILFGTGFSFRIPNS